MASFPFSWNRVATGALVTRLLLGIVLLSVSLAGDMHAQGSATDLRVQGTMALNLTWNTAHVSSYFPDLDSPLRLGQQRFSGRIAFRVKDRMYVGASVESWQFNFTRHPGSGTIDAVSEAVNLSPYLQFYPLRRAGVFLRCGPGLVNTWAYVGSGNIIQGYKGNRLSASGGLGTDLPVRRHLALTLSADYTQVFGSKNYAEAKSAVMLGIGMTVR